MEEWVSISVSDLRPYNEDEGGMGLGLGGHCTLKVFLWTLLEELGLSFACIG